MRDPKKLDVYKQQRATAPNVTRMISYFEHYFRTIFTFLSVCEKTSST